MSGRCDSWAAAGGGSCPPSFSPSPPRKWKAGSGIARAGNRNGEHKSLQWENSFTALINHFPFFMALKRSSKIGHGRTYSGERCPPQWASLGRKMCGEESSRGGGTSRALGTLGLGVKGHVAPSPHIGHLPRRSDFILIPGTSSWKS